MSIVDNIIKGASIQFGREFGRAGANAILKGSNYYSINNIRQLSNGVGVNPEKVLSVEPILEENNIPKYDKSLQETMVLQPDTKIQDQWVNIGWLINLIPILGTIVYYFRFLAMVTFYPKIINIIEQVLISGKSPATILHLIKIKDGRRTSGYYTKEALIVTDKYIRNTTNEEKIQYLKMYKKYVINKFIVLSVVLLVIMPLGFIITIPILIKNLKKFKVNYK